MRISDWSSNVCSSDLPSDGRLLLGWEPQHDHRPRALFADREPPEAGVARRRPRGGVGGAERRALRIPAEPDGHARPVAATAAPGRADRKSGVSGKGGSVRVDLGGRRSINKKKTHTHKVDDKQ